MPRLLEPKEEYTIDYPEVIAYAEAQQDIFWTANEIEMEKDLHTLRTGLTEAEHHAVTESLKLFTLYELKVGDYWLDYVYKTFRRPDIQRMAATFGFFEHNVHAPFYNKVNEVLGLNTDEFYNSWKKDKDLRTRIDWITNRFNDDPIWNTALASLIEGVVLYSNFAFFKHFQAEGKNKLVNLCAGINFSVRDENLHSEAGAWLHKTLIRETRGDLGSSNPLRDAFEEELTDLKKGLITACAEIYNHESRIIDILFSKGPMKGITPDQMKTFVKARINLCLNQLSIEPAFDVTYDPISKWFYKNINSGQLHDFFHKQGSSYNRAWVEGRFQW